MVHYKRSIFAVITGRGTRPYVNSHLAAINDSQILFVRN